MSTVAIYILQYNNHVLSAYSAEIELRIKIFYAEISLWTKFRVVWTLRARVTAF